MFGVGFQVLLLFVLFLNFGSLDCFGASQRLRQESTLRTFLSTYIGIHIYIYIYTYIHANLRHMYICLYMFHSYTYPKGDPSQQPFL